MCGVLRGCDAAENSSHPEFHNDSDLGSSIYQYFADRAPLPPAISVTDILVYFHEAPVYPLDSACHLAGPGAIRGLGFPFGRLDLSRCAQRLALISQRES